MIVEQIWIEHAWRNFNYLVACPETGEALAIDPLDHAPHDLGGEVAGDPGEHEAPLGEAVLPAVSGGAIGLGVQPPLLLRQVSPALQGHVEHGARRVDTQERRQGVVTVNDRTRVDTTSQGRDR